MSLWIFFQSSVGSSFSDPKFAWLTSTKALPTWEPYELYFLKCNKIASALISFSYTMNPLFKEVKRFILFQCGVTHFPSTDSTSLNQTSQSSLQTP